MNSGYWRASLVGVGLALVGVWGAWVPHRTAALVLSGWDLAEFVKFVPGISATRELFYLPVWCAGIAVGALAGRTKGQHSRQQVIRAGLTLFAVGLMVSLLPPYPHVLNGYQAAEFRWQFFLGVGGLLVVLCSALWTPRWRVPAVGVLMLLLAPIGAIPVLWQFLHVRGAIQEVYGAALGWGWGLGVFVTGWALVGAAGGWLLIGRARGRA